MSSNDNRIKLDEHFEALDAERARSYVERMFGDQ